MTTGTASVRGMGTEWKKPQPQSARWWTVIHQRRHPVQTAPSSSGSQRKEWKKTTTQLPRLLSHGPKSCVI